MIFDGADNAVLFDLTAADYTYVEGITVRNTEVAFLLGRKRILGAVGFTLKIHGSKMSDVESLPTGAARATSILPTTSSSAGMIPRG